MTKNINYVSHKKSSKKVNGKPQLPSPGDLVLGEIAINFAKDVETLSIKNESGTVVTFSSDNYYTEQKLGSGFTGANSARTVTEVIEHDEEVTAAALNNLNDIKLDVTAYTPVDLTNYYTKDETSGKTEISNALSGKVNSTTFTEHTADTNLHFSGNEKENLDALATNIAAISGITADKIDSWNAAAGQDLTQYYKKTETSGKTELETAFSAKADNSDLTTLSGTVTGHTANTDIHVTSADKTAWNAKADLSDIPSVTGYADSVKYNSTSKEVEFYHGTTAGTKVFSYDASPFIIDGMVDDVEIKDVTSGETQVTCLVISFNTDAGKQDINIPISQIFDASNYYTTAQTDTKITEATSGKVDNTTYTAYTAATTTEIGNKLATSDFNTYSGTVDTAIGLKASQSDLNTLSGTVTAHTTDGDIHVTTSDKTKWNKVDDKQDVSGMTAYTEAATTSALNNIVTAHTADTSIHFTTGDVKTQIDNSISGKADTTAVTQSIEAAVSGKANSSDVYTKLQTSGASEIATALEGKQPVGDYALKSEIPTVPTDVSAFNNDAGYITSSALNGYATEDYVTAATSDMATKTWVGEQNYLTSADISGKQDVSGMTAYTTTATTNTLSGTVTAHTADTTIHVTADDKSKWNNVDNKLNTSDFDAYSGAVDTAIDNKAEQSDLSTLSGTVTGHTADSTIHVTSSDKSTWNAKLDSGDVANFFDDAKYEDSGTSKVINFYHGSTIKATIDADDFIKDGMISGVTLESKSGTTYLVINWNTDAGIETTELNIGDIFEADNYYTKSETSGKTEISTALGTKVNSATFTAHATNTSAHFSGDEKENLDSLATNIAAISGITSTKVSNWDTAATSAHNHSNKSTLDAITASSAAINSLTGAVGTMAFQNTSSYSSATQVETALGKKSDTGHTHVKADITDFPAINDGTFTISGNGVAVVSTSANASANKGLNIKPGTNVSITTASSEITIAATDTTYTAGSFVTITGSNNSINVTTGTTSSSVSRGDHNHDAVYQKMSVSGTAAQLSAGTDTTQRVWTAKNLKDGMDAVYAKTADVENMEQTLAAGLSDVNERMAEKSALNSLVSTVNDIRTTGISSRRLARKDFTSYGLTWFINTLKKAVADQDLEKYGMKVGDYFTVNHGGKTYNYVIAGLNTMRGSVGNYRVTQSHVGIIVDTNDTHAWNTAGNTYTSQNSYSTGGTWTIGASAAGYANCDLHYYLTTTVLSNVESDLGSANLLSHYKLYGNSINTTGYNRYGSNGGCTNSWAWYADQKICALSEIQVYGSIVWSSSGYDTGEVCRQLDVFRVYNMNEIFEGRYPWLRDVASASYACSVDIYGFADYDPANFGYCVAALILFA